MEDGTPVRLRIGRTVSSADAHVDDKVDFEVLDDIKVNDLTVVSRGGLALATVTEAQHKKRMGRGGKLNMNIDSVRLNDGEKVPLRAVKTVEGGGHVGAMTGAIVGTAILFWPAAPFFLFMHGKDITVPKGTEITAYINGNAAIDRAKFEPPPVAAPPPQIPAELAVSSNQTGADIELDGHFVGSTPSKLQMTPGEHSIRITKKGFIPWERKMTAAAGSINLDADLEPDNPAPQAPQ